MREHRTRGTTGLKPLVRCPRCDSGLIYPLTRAPLGAYSTLERRCPECEHRDRVIASTAAVDAWYRNSARIRASLRALSEALGDGLPLEIEQFPAR